MDENLAMVLLIVAIIVSVTLIFGAMILWSEAKIRGWEDGFHENERYHRMAIDAIEARIKTREHALALYRDISATLCDNVSDCMYCPYERDRNDHRCALWELNEAVKRMDIDDVHVDTKHDGGD